MPSKCCNAKSLPIYTHDSQLIAIIGIGIHPQCREPHAEVNPVGSGFDQIGKFGYSSVIVDPESVLFFVAAYFGTDEYHAVVAVIGVWNEDGDGLSIGSDVDIGKR